MTATHIQRAYIRYSQNVSGCIFFITMHPITAAIQTSPTIIQLPISFHPAFFSGSSFSIASLALSTSTLPFTTRRLSLSKCFRFSTVSSINLFCSSLMLFTPLSLCLCCNYMSHACKCQYCFCNIVAFLS